jgi:hypothetical protein
MYIRSNEDWYHANGKTPEQVAEYLRKELEEKHVPDSIREEIKRELRCLKK